MAQPSPRKSRRGLMGCLLLFVLFLLGVVLAVVGTAYWSSQRVKTAVNAKPLVNISSPATSSRVEQNVPLVVNARAEHSSYILRVELYADGALVAVQQSTLSNGSNPLMFMQSWTPTTLGRHVLLARAYARNGQSADSGVVYVDVVPLLTPSIRTNVDAIPRPAGGPSPSLNDVADAAGTTADRLREANPPLSGLDSTSPITPGTPIDIPRSPEPPPPSPAPGGPPAPLPDAPTAPTDLVVTADCVNAQLTWSDSPDEEQYIVYRLAPGDSTLNPIATLPADTTLYSDALATLGVYRYQVAAQRGGLEGLSGMAETSTPGTCVPPAIASRLVVSILSVDTTETWSRGLYCWDKIDTSEWDRVPAGSDALMPLAADPRRYDFTTLPGGLRFTFDHAETNPVVIGMDCWGRSDTTASQLNPRFTTNHPPEEWDGTTREFTAPTGSFKVRYCISRDLTGCDISLLPGTEPVPGSGSLLPWWGEIHLPPFGPLLTLPKPTNLRIRGGVEACDELPTDMERGACVLAIFFGGADTVYWDWNGGALYDESTITGYHLAVHNGDTMLYERDVAPGTHKFTLARTGDLPCGAHITYSVQTVAGTSRSGYGTPIAYDTRPCTDEVELTITYGNFVLGPSAGRSSVVDNEVSTDQQLELYGDLGVTGPIEDGWIWATPPFWSIFGSGIRTCPESAVCVSAGTYNFADQRLRRRSVPFDLGSYHNNSLTLNLHSGQTLTLDVMIFDSDNVFLLPNSDDWCVTHREVTHTMDEWSSLNEAITLTDDHGEGSCAIQVQIQGRPVP